MLEVVRTLLEACRGRWEMAFKAKWIRSASDSTVHIAVQVGYDLDSRATTARPLERGRL